MKVSKIGQFVNSGDGIIRRMNGHKAPFVKIAWLFIVVLVGGMAFLQTLRPELESGQPEDPAGLVITQLQAEYLLGVSKLTGLTQEVMSEADMLDTGTVDQRQRYMAFMIALDLHDEAKESVLHLNTDLEKAGITLSERHATTQEMLDFLIEGGTLPTDQSHILDELGWFGTLLKADSIQRQQMQSAAASKVLTLLIVLFAVILAGVGGFVMLIIFLIRACGGTLQSGMNPQSNHHGLYAEVFALWMMLFAVLLMIAGSVSMIFADTNLTINLLFTLIAFFGSLIALYWSIIRGITWEQLRNDIGWHRGAGFFTEFGWGLIGYAMTVPILGIGIVCTFVLIFLQQFFAGGVEANPFGGTGGGSHPIIVEIANGGWQLRVLVLVLAAIAAPIIEETMFRGVLYRQLRSSGLWFCKAFSIVGSTMIVSFVFAAIHPQGWVAIPVLMSIAIGMNLVRELRGSIIPSMVVHGVNNGIVMSMLLYFLS